MEKTERAGMQVKMDVLLQTAEESCLLGSDAWYGKLRDVVYALYEQKEIPLEMLLKAERRLGQLEMDVRLAEHGLTPLPQPAPEQPKQETVRDVADWLEASEKGGGETGMGIHFRLLEMCGRVTRTDTAGRGGKPCPVFLLDKENVNEKIHRGIGDGGASG